MTMPNEVVAEYIVGQALLTRPSLGQNWPLYIGNLPDIAGVKNDIAVIFNTSGLLHGKDMEGAQHQHYGFQLRFRSMLAKSGYDKAQTIVTALLAMHKETVSVESGESYSIQSFTQMSDIIPISVDEKGRMHHTVNLIVAYSSI